MQGFHGGWLYLAKWYATYEQSCKLSNIPCVTSRFDANSLERIDQNLRAYFGSKENIFKTPAGRTAFADQRQYDSTIFTRQVIEADKIEGKTLKKGKRPTKYSKELQEDASKSGFPIVTDEELTNEIKEQNKEGDNNG
jgi:hypothetical protein